MRRLADYTIGLVIVLVHLVVISWNDEKVQLSSSTTR